MTNDNTNDTTTRTVELEYPITSEVDGIGECDERLSSAVRSCQGHTIGHIHYTAEDEHPRLEHDDVEITELRVVMEEGTLLYRYTAEVTLA